MCYNILIPHTDNIILAYIVKVTAMLLLLNGIFVKDLKL